MSNLRGDPFADRIGYLESIRGLAALQVLLLHTFAAFIPNLVFQIGPGSYGALVRQSPLFFFYDGFSAVYLFFALSGTVLTYAFNRNLNHPIALMSARVFRLLVPIIAACALSFAIRWAVGSPNIRAGDISASAWLSTLWQPPTGLGFLLKDMFVNSLLLGYPGTSTLSLFGFRHVLDPIAWSYAAPLWSLSIEFQGSIFLLLLCLVQRYSALAWYVLVAILTIVTFRTHFLSFIVGHVIAIAAIKRWRLILPWVVAGAFILGGIALCVSVDGGQLAPFVAACQARLSVIAPCTLDLQKTYGAMLLYVGLLASTPVTRLLSAAPLVQLGRLSFSLYLVHWPIVFGIASLALVLAEPQIGAVAARGLACGVAIVVSLIAAMAISRIDAFAISGARWLRGSLSRMPTVR